MHGSTKLSEFSVTAVNTNLKISTERAVRHCYDECSPLLETVVDGALIHRVLVDGLSHSDARAYGSFLRVPHDFPFIFIID